MKFASQNLPGAIPALQQNARDLREGVLRMGVSRHANWGEAWVETFPVNSDWNTLAKRELKGGHVWALNVNQVLEPSILAETAKMVERWNSGQLVWDPQILRAVYEALQCSAGEFLQICRKKSNLTEEQVVLLLTASQGSLMSAAAEVKNLSPQGLGALVLRLRYRRLSRWIKYSGTLEGVIRDAFVVEKKRREALNVQGFDALIPWAMFSPQRGGVLQTPPQHVLSSPEGWKAAPGGAFTVKYDDREGTALVICPEQEAEAEVEYEDYFIAIKWH